MGWDAFGLPAEQYAGYRQRPADLTAEKYANFKRQNQCSGLSDWDREVTIDPNYYKWTQDLHRCTEKGLAYEAEVPVNWVEELGTAIANEEVLPDGNFWSAVVGPVPSCLCVSGC